MSLRRKVGQITLRSSEKIVIALSGGVDSAVAAALLQREHEHVHAIHMSNWNSDDDDTVEGCGEQDWRDAEKVADYLGMNISRQFFEKDYWNHVFQPYLTNISRGKMGNPDVGCNVHVKFGSLQSHIAQKYGSQTPLATGHYARLWHRHLDPPIPPCLEEVLSPENEWILHWGQDRSSLNPSTTLLLSAADKAKDQSYFLSACSSKQLSNVIFPLGDVYKKENPSADIISPTVRQLASQFNLPNAGKKESMGICFVGKRRGGFAGFLQEYLPMPKSKLQFVDVDTGEVLETSKEAQHVILYTIGQGAKLGGRSKKYFVADMQPDSNRIMVCQGTHHPALFCDSASLEPISWITGEPPSLLIQEKKMRMQCRIRHLQPLIECHVAIEEGDRCTVRFDKAVRGVTPGQMCVFYALDGLVCLGGAAIVKRGQSYLEQNRSISSTMIHPSGHNDMSMSS